MAEGIKTTKTSLNKTVSGKDVDLGVEVQIKNRFENIENKDLIPVHWSLNGTAAATATNYGKIFTALRAYDIIEVSEVHAVAGSDGGAVTLNLERLQGTEALGAGDEILATAFSLKSTANTVLTKKTTDLQNRKLSIGDRIALKDGGVLTAVDDVQVTILLKPLGKGDYR